MDLSKKKKIKNMNSKMTTNSQVLRTTPETKQKLSKQLEQERITEMEITWRVISGEGEGTMVGEGTGNKKQNRQAQNSQG